MRPRERGISKWLALFLLSFLPLSVRGEGPTPAGYVGSVRCLSCHRKEAGGWEKNPHVKTESQTPYGNLKGCEGCHGPGEVHVGKPQKGNIKSGKFSPEEAEGVCLKCHGTHGKAPVVPKEWRNVNTGQWRQSEHASLTCLQCHDAHGGEKRMLKKGVGTLCASCHARIEKMTHRPEDAARCLNCHLPHGSGLPSMVKSTIAQECQSCHNPAAPKILSKHQNYPIKGTNCLSCHTLHAKGAAKRQAHAPYRSRQCQACHNPPTHQNPLGLKGEMKGICLQCHEKQMAHQEGSLQHRLVKQQFCTSCHAPHATNASRNGLKDTEKRTCLSCHPRVAEAMNQKYKHKPVDEGQCLSCHSLHQAKSPSLLSDTKIALCTNCHKWQQRFTHPLGEKIKDPRTGAPLHCASCHNIHGSRHKGILSTDEAELCAICHREGHTPP